ncbi:hypothetical protein BDZ91DRAFT_625265, partial [Kalaharituber pfeilii]
SPRSAAIIAVNLIMSVIATAVVFLRMFTRSKILRSVGIDDWLILVGLVLAWTLALWNSVGTAWGLGKHVWDIPKEHFEGVGKIIWGTMSLYFPVLGVIKLSILFSLRRITPTAFNRQIIYIMMVFVVLLTVSMTLATIFQCNPIRKIYSIAPSLPTIPGVCVNRAALFYAGAALSIFSDVMILGIPIPMLLSLGFPLRQKFALVGLFSLGGVACIASIARMAVMHEALQSPDPSWVIYKYIITTCLEISLGIICASIPALKPFISKYL